MGSKCEEFLANVRQAASENDTIVPWAAKRLVAMVEAAIARADSVDECLCDIDPSLGLISVCVPCAIVMDFERIAEGK